MIKHYIENEELIPMLLNFGWIVRNNTWTDCPPETQEIFRKWRDSAYNLNLLGE